MAARSIGKSSISFGLVAIPVRLYPATEPRAGLTFNLLDAETKSRLKQQYVRPSDGKIIARQDMVKGYEFAKDQYVTFTADELKSLEERASATIDITEFVPQDRIDPIYFDKPYYLGPEKGGEKAYRLLCQAMKETGRAAIARYAARGKQHLVLIRPALGVEAGLVMQQLLYADEVRAFSEVPVPEVELKLGEMQLARQLVEQIAVQTFDPGKYHDEVRARVLSDIERKIQGHEIETAVPEAPTAQIIDLMEALKASLAADKGASAPSNPHSIHKVEQDEAVARAPAAKRLPAKRAERGARAPAAAGKASAARGRAKR